jgi:GNAT superfamily N-acetyltransferase
VVLVWDGKNIIAWGLIFLIGKIWEFSVYVKRSYRRKGIGSKIYRSIKKKLKILNIQIDVCRHDNVSGKFFDKMFKTNKKYGR